MEKCRFLQKVLELEVEWMEPYCFCSLCKMLWFWLEDYFYWVLDAEKEVYMESGEKVCIKEGNPKKQGFGF